MRMVKYYFLLLCTILLGNTSGTEEGVVYYTNSWIVEIPGGIKAAKCVALKTGFILTQPVSTITLLLVQFSTENNF